MTERGEPSSASELRLDLPSEIRYVDLVHASTERLGAMAGFDEGTAMNVAIAVREALINAIQHGNRERPGARVRVALTLVGDGLRASVLDEGDGFDPGLVEDPTSGPNLLATSGRGLLMIRAFVDEVEFNRPAEGGTEIVMVKRRESEADGRD